ncbi:hypothetical protein [Roseobacter sp. HKCCA0434]|uniref:hypothetical protein n=1 Tax=Roseobacter sp. HKCCA0434 TaxID=3079297 RepID=UPI002905F6B5|nr:hypothetical protein [Roseobacter sp. HKCCA0434]
MSFEPTWPRRIRRALFTSSLRADSWELIAQLIDSDMDTGQALELAAKTMKGRGSGTAADILWDIRESLATGRLTQALQFYGSGGEAPLFANAAHADLGVLLTGAGRIARTDTEIKRATSAALAMPALLFVAIGILYYVLGTQLFPVLREISNPLLWNPITSLVATIAEGGAANGQLIASIVVLMAVAAFLSRPIWTGRLRRFADRVPPWNVYRFRYGVGFAMAVVELARAGGDVNSRAIRRMAEHASPYARDRMERVAVELETVDIGTACMKAGPDFPDRDLSPVLEALAPRVGGIVSFGTYLDRWIGKVERTMKRNVAILNLMFLAFFAVSLAAAMIAMLTSVQAVQ